MTLEEINKIITDLRQQIPQLQVQLNQAQGYKQALLDLGEKEGIRDTFTGVESVSASGRKQQSGDKK